MEALKQLKSIQVHAGTFHADDVTCCAQAMILNNKVTIIRCDTVEDSNLEEGEIIADVGGGMFDHHQKDAQIRDDGFKHCAASLLWKFWGEDVIKKVLKNRVDAELVHSIWKSVDEKFMMTMSISDNGICSKDVKLDTVAMGISSIVSFFNPTWMEADDDENRVNSFLDCVNIVEKVFRRYIINAMSSVIANKQVMELMKERKDEHIFILDKYISWEDAVCTDKSIYCVIYPSMRGGWNVQLAPESVGSYNTLISVPEWWKGYKYSGKNDRPIGGMTFCHATGFLSAYDTKEHAVRAANYLVELAVLEQKQ